MQEAFAAHLRHVGRAYPRDKYQEVVLLIDNAPWHRGKPINEALADNPHLLFKRLPAYSPKLNPIERFWKKLGGVAEASEEQLGHDAQRLDGSITSSGASSAAPNPRKV